MPFKKPAILLCSSNPLQNVAPIPSITSSLGRRPSPRTASSAEPDRRYASTTHHGRGHGPFPDSVPEWPKSQYPSPYDIFAMNKDAPYTKHRFHQLVKLYHPDKHSHSSALDHIPHATRVERYRLIVAAHDLLSDPSRRQLYDLHGAGWTGGKPQTLHESMRQADRSWRYQPGNAAHNATWEDWEKWYEARDGKPREPVYMSNGLFASLVVMMCMVGALAQMNRASESGADYIEMRNQSNQAIGMQMAQMSQRAAGRSKDERVDTFLRERENVTYQFVPSKYEGYDPEEGKA